MVEGEALKLLHRLFFIEGLNPSLSFWYLHLIEGTYLTQCIKQPFIILFEMREIFYSYPNYCGTKI